MASVVLSSPIPSSDHHLEEMWNSETGSLGGLPTFIKSRFKAIMDDLEGSNPDEVQEMVLSVYGKFYYRNGIFPDCDLETLATTNEDISMGMWGPMDFMPGTGTLKGWSVLDRLPELGNLPIFLLSGGHDIVSPATVQAMHHVWALSERILYPDCSHNNQLENPQETNRDMADFLRRVESSHAANQFFEPIKVMTTAYGKMPHVEQDDDSEMMELSLNQYGSSWAVVLLTFVVACGMGFVVGNQDGRRRGYQSVD